MERTPGHRNGYRGLQEAHRVQRGESPLINMVRSRSRVGDPQGGASRVTDGDQRRSVDRTPFREILGQARVPLIGTVGVPPLPETIQNPWAYIEQRIEKVRTDILTLRKVGFQAVVISDLESPTDGVLDPVDQMLYNREIVQAAVRAAGPDLKVGVEVAGDPQTALKEALIGGADFVRVDVGSLRGGGTLEEQMSELVRVNRAGTLGWPIPIDRPMYILAGVRATDGTSISSSVREMVNAKVDGIIATATGRSSYDDIEEAIGATGSTVPVFIDSDLDNLSLHELTGAGKARGVIFGESIQGERGTVDLGKALRVSNYFRN